MGPFALFPHLLLTGAATVAPEALLAGAHEQAHALVGQHTLLHAESLLIVSTHDLEDVALRSRDGACQDVRAVSERALCTRTYLELITQDLALDLGGDTLVIEVAQLGVVIDLQFLLAARGRVRDVELHGYSELAAQGIHACRRLEASSLANRERPQSVATVRGHRLERESQA